MALNCVPFNPLWPTAVGQSGALLLDIHAIYRRPHIVVTRDQPAYIATDAAGFPLWDLTGALPVRDHAKWTARGFQYVTLATRTDLVAVSKGELGDQGLAPLMDWSRYQQHPVTRDPWHAAAYLADLRREREEETSQLKELIRTAGPAIAEQMMRHKYPQYQLPEAFVDAVLAEPAQTETSDSPARRGPGRPRKVTEAVA